VLAFFIISIEAAPKRGHFDQGTALADVGQTEASPDQAAPRKNVLDLFGGGAGSDIEILGRLAQQQVANTAADNEGLEASLLKFADDIACMRTELSEPYAVFGLGDGDELFDDDLRFVTG
jgi:hypothetical protein